MQVDARPLPERASAMQPIGFDFHSGVRDEYVERLDVSREGERERHALGRGGNPVAKPHRRLAGRNRSPNLRDGSVGLLLNLDAQCASFGRHVEKLTAAGERKPEEWLVAGARESFSSLDLEFDVMRGDELRVVEFEP